MHKRTLAFSRCCSGVPSILLGCKKGQFANEMRILARTSSLRSALAESGESECGDEPLTGLLVGVVLLLGTDNEPSPSSLLLLALTRSSGPRSTDLISSTGNTTLDSSVPVHRATSRNKGAEMSRSSLLRPLAVSNSLSAESKSSDCDVWRGERLCLGLPRCWLSELSTASVLCTSGGCGITFCGLGAGLIPLLVARFDRVLPVVEGLVFDVLGTIGIGSLLWAGSGALLLVLLVLVLVLLLVLLPVLLLVLFVLGLSVLEVLERKRSSVEPCDELLRANCNACTICVYSGNNFKKAGLRELKAKDSRAYIRFCVSSVSIVPISSSSSSYK